MIKKRKEKKTRTVDDDEYFPSAMAAAAVGSLANQKRIQRTAVAQRLFQTASDTHTMVILDLFYFYIVPTLVVWYSSNLQAHIHIHRCACQILLPFRVCTMTISRDAFSVQRARGYTH